MADQPESLVLQLLRGIRADMATKAELGELKGDLGDLRAEVHSLRADVASDLAAMQAKADAEHKATRQQLGDEIAGLRRAVGERLSAVIAMAS